MNRYKPVLLLVYNRPRLTERVCKEIKNNKPSKLYISADGPKSKNQKDKRNCNEVRRIVSSINWKCKVYYNFYDTNLGCGKAVSSGIEWFFKNEDCGIILEDDCLPNQDFFDFCNTLLNYYKYDNRILTISGSNYLLNDKQIKYSYYFSKYFHSGAWATWKRAWEHFDYDLETWPEIRSENLLLNVLNDQSAVDQWTWLIDMTYRGFLDSWAIRFSYASFINNGLHIIPRKNMVSNIGFGTPNATHTRKESPFANMKTYKMQSKLKHPDFIIEDNKADDQEQSVLYGRVNPFKKRYRQLTNGLHNVIYRLINTF